MVDRWVRVEIVEELFTWFQINKADQLLINQKRIHSHASHSSILAVKINMYKSALFLKIGQLLSHTKLFTKLLTSRNKDQNFKRFES